MAVERTQAEKTAKEEQDGQTGGRNFVVCVWKDVRFIWERVWLRGMDSHFAC